MRNIRNCLFVLVIACPLPVLSADLYGKVWVSPDSKPARDARVSISCSGSVQTDAKVDRYGRYRLTRLPIREKCQLWITYAGASSGKVNAYSGTGSKMMNIELRSSGQGWSMVIH